MIEFKTKEDFLLDMLEYYSEDPDKRRSVHAVHQSCSYSPIPANKANTSEGCAIGRVIEPNMARHFDEELCGTGVSESDIFDELPKWLQLLGQDFLVQVQVLHDSSHCWESDGLTGDGMSMLDNVIKVNKLDRELFLNYF